MAVPVEFQFICVTHANLPHISSAVCDLDQCGHVFLHRLFGCTKAPLATVGHDHRPGG